MKVYLNLLFLFYMACSAVLCEFELRVRVHSYLNAESRCASCTISLGNPVYSCCDNSTNTGVCTGEERCDTFFRYCLRPLGDTRIECLEFMAVDTALFSPNTDALFNIGDTLFGSGNPFTFFGYDWTGFQFFLRAKDSDLFDSPQGGVKDIDSFAIDLDIEGGQRLGPRLFQGRFGIAEIELSFEVVCLSDYSLPNCTACVSGSSAQCISRSTAQLVTATTSVVATTTLFVVAMVTLPSSDQSDVSIDTGAIVGGVIGTIIIIILVVMAITALAYKILSKKANYYESGDTFVVTAPPLLGDNPVYAAMETQPEPLPLTTLGDSSTYASIEARPPLVTVEEEREFNNPLYGDTAPPNPQEGANQYATLIETEIKYSTPYTPYYEPVAQ